MQKRGEKTRILIAITILILYLTLILIQGCDDDTKQEVIEKGCLDKSCLNDADDDGDDCNQEDNPSNMLDTQIASRKYT